MAARKQGRISTAAVVESIDAIVQPSLAQDWDNVGLLAGDRRACCQGVLLCIDLTDPVLREGIRKQASLVAAYHPPIFRPISRLLPDSGGQEAVVFNAISGGVGVYSMHTALDAVAGGTNDVLADLCGLVAAEPFEAVPAGPAKAKVVVFVPADRADRVADAAFGCGAGVIGDYRQCSFRSSGTGTFLGGEATQPAVGRRGRLERVEELRLEFIAPAAHVAEVLKAIRDVHPYEKPAIDVVALTPEPGLAGMGRAGRFGRSTTLRALAKRLIEATGAAGAQVVGRPGARLTTGAVCAGAAGRVLLDSPVARRCDVIVTGEISHHDALAYQRAGTAAIALGHWASERPVLPVVAAKLRRRHPGLPVHVSRADRDPFSVP